MSLHLRKMMVQQIEDSKSPRHELMSADWYEQQTLDAMLLDDPHGALGSLTVIVADLLELVRRSDPAYGLTPVESVTFKVDADTFGDSDE
jgi:hypothetical protein